jgi:hypothetical protein
MGRPQARQGLLGRAVLLPRWLAAALRVRAEDFPFDIAEYYFHCNSFVLQQLIFGHILRVKSATSATHRRCKLILHRLHRQSHRKNPDLNKCCRTCYSALQ